MMVVPGRTAHEVTAAVDATVHSADQAELSQYGEGAVNGNQPHSGIVNQHLFMDGFRGEVAVSVGDDVKHGMALWGELIAVLSQYAGNPVRREFHLGDK
jgi:hypothetical protein